MTFHAIQMADGSVAIMQTVGDASVADCIAKWPQSEQAKIASHQPIRPDDIPRDRTFRDAWKLTGSIVTHDMEKARNILRDRLRDQRAPLLAALDIELQRATTELPRQPTDDILAQKQALRDVTENPAIDLAKTVDELKSLTLEALTAAAGKSVLG